MPDIIIFLGPSLKLDEARRIVDADFRPPIKRGDLLSFASESPKVVGIIDGLFFDAAAVGHREILSLLNAGIRVIGASSMGALRAAELSSFGMEGVGEIYSRYQSGSLESDDEVALICDPINHTALSEALINVRISCEVAISEEVLSPYEADLIIRTTKEIYYPERTWQKIIKDSPLDQEKADIFKSWVADNRIDQKRDDAILALIYIRGIVTQS